MEKRRKSLERSVDRGFLVKELAAFEKRMDARMEARLDSRLEMQTESLKLYVNGRFTQVNERFDKIEGRFDNLEDRFENLEMKVDRLDKKIDVNTAGLVEMIERGFGGIAGIRLQVDNHESRITTLESKSIS